MVDSPIRISEQLGSNWNYTSIQLDFYFAFAKDQHLYQCAMQGMNNTNKREATIALIASMKQFVKSIQYLFFEYLLKDDYDQDIKRYNWKRKFTMDDYINITWQLYEANKQLDQLAVDLPQMILVVDLWSQKYGCFRTYNQKVEFESWEDELDAQM